MPPRKGWPKDRAEAMARWAAPTDERTRWATGGLITPTRIWGMPVVVDPSLDEGCWALTDATQTAKAPDPAPLTPESLQAAVRRMRELEPFRGDLCLEVPRRYGKSMLDGLLKDHWRHVRPLDLTDMEGVKMIDKKKLSEIVLGSGKTLVGEATQIRTEYSFVDGPSAVVTLRNVREVKSEEIEIPKPKPPVRKIQYMVDFSGDRVLCTTDAKKAYKLNSSLTRIVSQLNRLGVKASANLHTGIVEVPA